MRTIALIALLLAVAAWVLTGMTTVNILSGPFEGRACQTDCVSTLFWAGVGTGVVALLLGLIGVIRPGARVLGSISLLLAVPLCGIFAVLIIIGTTQV